MLRPTCFWCGGDLFGAVGDPAAQKRTFASYTPCDTCRATMAGGIAMIEVIGVDDGPLPALGSVGPLSACQPTGRWLMVARDAYLFDVMPIEQRQLIMSAGRAIIEPETYEALVAKG